MNHYSAVLGDRWLDSSWALVEDIVRGVVAELKIHALLTSVLFAIEIFIKNSVAVAEGA